MAGQFRTAMALSSLAHGGGSSPLGTQRQGLRGTPLGARATASWPPVEPSSKSAFGSGPERQGSLHTAGSLASAGSQVNLQS